VADSDTLKPDFLIIGAMKCGTSTVQAQLAAQSGVFMTTPKEPNFFSDDAVYHQGMAWYEHLFSPARPTDLKGEASTHYTKLPTYPDTLKRMQAALPAVRLIYVIRNPVQRAVSHYIHEWTEARMGHDPLEAFRSHPELVDYGRYGMQIAPFIKAYGADQVLLTSLEQLKTDPSREFSRICSFLGAPEQATWQHDLEAQNVSSERARALPFQGLLIDNPVARTLRRRLVPKAIRTRIRQARTMQTRPELPASMRATLEAQFLEDRAQLTGFFPDHPALTACYPFAPS
jgi:hypothetical protein